MKKNIGLLIIAVLILNMTRLTFADTTTHLVDVGDHNLYVQDNNPKEDDQVNIIFEAGYGDDMTSFDDLIQLLDGKARLISYDRAGLGQSQDTRKRKTVFHQVRSLEKILDELDIHENIIFVGHSIGGYNARVFSKRNDVSGVVLIDASHEDQNKGMKALLPPESWDMYMAQFTAEGSYKDINHSARLVRKSRNAYEDIPLIIIAGNQHGGGEIESLWIEYQNDLASLSANSEMYVLNAGHYVHQEQSECVAKRIIDLINDIK